MSRGGEGEQGPRPVRSVDPSTGSGRSGTPYPRSASGSGIEEAFGGLLELGAEVGMGDVDQLLGPFPDGLPEESGDAVLGDYGVGEGAGARLRRCVPPAGGQSETPRRRGP